MWVGVKNFGWVWVGWWVWVGGWALFVGCGSVVCSVGRSGWGCLLWLGFGGRVGFALFGLVGGWVRFGLGWLVGRWWWGLVGSFLRFVRVVLGYALTFGFYSVYLKP